MEAVFLQVLNMSITGSYIIFAVMILRLLLKKAPKKYSYLMWAVCAFRLCCPVSFGNIFSIFNLSFFSMPQNSGASLEHIPQNIGMMQSPRIYTGLNSMDGIVNSSLPAPTDAAASINPMQIIIFIAAIIWIAGIAAMLLYSIISYIMLRVKLRNSILYKKNIYQSDKITSPFVFGFIKPKIYIPFGIAENEMEYVLSHEQYHIKRRDYLIKPAVFLILTLHWFNPICWIAFMMMSCDMEMSCDEKVLSNGKAMSKEYSSSLLSFAVGKRPPSPCPLAFGETRIKGRIKNILKYRKPKIYVSVISVILCAVAIIACASNPQNDNSDISYSNLKMSDETLTEFCENNLGAIMANIDYSDSEKIVFHYGNGIFVYNHKNGNMEKCLDLNNLDCAYFQQGDYGVYMTVSADGREALLVNYGEYDKNFKNYIINLESGSAKETDETELSNPFSSFAETSVTVTDAKGWTSVRCGIENDNYWYLTCNQASVGDMKLCLYKSGETVWDNYIFESKAELQKEIIRAAIPSGAEIIANSGAHWEIDGSAMRGLTDRLAVMFSNIDDKAAREAIKNIARINEGMFDVWFYGINQGVVSYPYYLFIIDSNTSELLLSANLVTENNMMDISATLELYRTGVSPLEDYNAFGPQDIHDLESARLIAGNKVYSILDNSDLSEIEEMLSTVSKIKGGTGCPFDAGLMLTRADGTEGMVLLASDSCAVYKSDDVYYDYSDGDNSRLLSLFGINADTLFNTLYQ